MLRLLKQGLAEFSDGVQRFLDLVVNRCDELVTRGHGALQLRTLLLQILLLGPQLPIRFDVGLAVKKSHEHDDDKYQGIVQKRSCALLQ